MNDADDLQEFITDCEFKTRKILRESNRRMKDTARLLAARERVDKLKHRGGKSDYEKSITSSKPFNKSIDNIPSAQKAHPPSSSGKSIPVKKWKDQDKIIHDAYETIKSFDTKTTSSSKASIDANIHLANPLHNKVGSSLKASLESSPFVRDKRTFKGNQSKAVPEKSHTTKYADSDDEGTLRRGEPAMVTRRTIERDFYIMSKRRNKPSKRRQRVGGDEKQAPELKLSVLWKKYRCDDRVMEEKAKRAERLYEEYERLPNYADETDGTRRKHNIEDPDCESSSSSDAEEEVYAHAIHDLVESHVADENYRSQRRTDKMLMKIQFKPNVADMWKQLDRGTNDKKFSNDEDPTTNRTEVSNGLCQYPSVPLHVATREFEHDHNVKESAMDEHPFVNGRPTNNDQAIARWVCPYKEPHERTKLIVNEALMTPLMKRTTALTISITAIHHPQSNCIWSYEIYDPSNGESIHLELSESDFATFNKSLRVSITDRSVSARTGRIVHNSLVENASGSSHNFVVMVTADGMKISCSIYRFKGSSADGLSLPKVKDAAPICTLLTCEVLQLLEKQQNYSVLDREFWLSSDNNKTIWEGLISILCSNKSLLFKSEQGSPVLPATKATLLSQNQLRVSTMCVKSHDSLIALSSIIKKMSSKDEMRKLFLEVKGGSHQHTRKSHLPPLSMRVSGYSPYPESICPGQTDIGRRGIWRLFHPIQEEPTKTSFPVWPSPADIKCPAKLDKTQASSRFYFKDIGFQKGTSVAALSSLAFESPVLAPECYVTAKGFTVPPYSDHEKLDGVLPVIKIPCANLTNHPVQSRLDTLLPKPIIVLDPETTIVDWKDAPTNKLGQYYHRRDVLPFDSDGFRITTLAHAGDYDDSIPSLVYGISEKAALPNQPKTAEMITHKSYECCTQVLSRERTAIDYHHIAESDSNGTLNEPYLFTTHMSAYGPVHLSRNSVSSHRKQKKLLSAAKEAERKKKAIELKMRAAEELVEARLKDHVAKLEESVKKAMSVPFHVSGSTPSFENDNLDEQSVSANLTSAIYASTDEPHVQNEKIACDVELPNLSKCGAHEDSNDDLHLLASALLANTAFLKAIARKLSIPEDQISQIEHIPLSTNRGLNQRRIENIEKPNDNADLESSFSHTAENKMKRGQEIEALKSSYPSFMPKLKLNCIKYRRDDHITLRGDGWKRLPRSEIVIGNFSLTKRQVQTAWRGPKYRKMEEKRAFIIVNSADKIKYTADSDMFVTKRTTMFIPDLTTERLRLAYLKRQQKQNEESILSTSQQRNLDEILQIPLSSPRQKTEDEKKAVIQNEDAVDHLVENSIEHTPSEHEQDTRPIDHVSKALLAVKHHNLADLEEMLDVEGVAVDSRDHHGNTLFILACQQGNKKLAKFLLRRRADINAKNNGGNTALHYLYEYGHVALAEYLMRKGADDCTRNCEGLTPYEGAHKENLSLI